MSVHEDDVLNEADQRWQRLVDTRPEIAEAVDLQRVLMTRTLELSAEAPDILKLATAAPADILERLSQRDAPVLEFGVEFNTERVTPFLLAFCNDFAVGGAGKPALNVRRAIEKGEIDSGSLMRGSLMRQQAAIRTRATQLGISADIVWLVGELSVGPLANLLQHGAFVSLHTTTRAVRDAASHWPRGHCAACGSWPALAETRASVRHLRCSFCGADWNPPEEVCVYCGTGGATFLTAAETAQTTRRLEFCRSCGGYLKQVDVNRSTPFALLPVLDLETSDLDVRAMERGYSRPSMHERTSADPLCPPNTVT